METNEQKEARIIQIMMDKPAKYAVFALNKGVTEEQVAAWNLPTMCKGDVIASRRCLFFFWQHESIIRETFEIGNYYSWVKNSKLTFV